MLYNFLKEFKNIIIDFFLIIKNPKKLLIWLSILPFNIIITLFNITIGFFFYLFLVFKLFLKLIQKKLKKKNIKPIKINKKNVFFNNYLLQTLHLLTFDLSFKTAFLFLYYQLNLIENISKKINIREKMKNILSIILIITLKRLFYYLTSIPYFIIKNNNEITLLIDDILSMNAESYKAYISTICLNLIKNFNLMKNVKTKKLKIKFNKKKMYLNPPKNFLEIVEKMKHKDKLVTGSNELLKNGKISMMSYIIKNRMINIPHPSLYYNTIDTINNKPAFLVINQPTKKYLETGKIVEEDLNNKLEKYTIKNKLAVKGVIKNEITAYNITPHLVHKEITQLIASEKLIKSWYKTENWIKQFNFIQSFFINMENKMYKIDKNYGLLEDENYKSVRNYLEINYINFTKDVQIGLENIFIFYDNNKELFLNDNNKLNFLKCLEAAEIDSEIRNFFWNILNKKI